MPIVYLYFLINLIKLLQIKALALEENLLEKLNNETFNQPMIPDVSIKYVDQYYETVHIEAYKSSSNDQILKEKNKESYKNLTWYSYGFPNIVSPDLNAIHFNDQGFHILVETLTKTQKELLFQQLAKKYEHIEWNITNQNVSVMSLNETEEIVNKINLTQIRPLIPNEIKCLLEINCNKDFYILKGRVNNLGKIVHRVDFKLNEMERNCLKTNINKKDNFEFECSLSTTDHNSDSNYLIIRPYELAATGIIERLFGSANNTYVTQEQINNIPYTYLHLLNKLDDYEPLLEKLNDAFFEDFTKKIPKVKKHLYIPLQEARKYISNFTIEYENIDLFPIELNVLLDVANFDKLVFLEKIKTNNFLYLDLINFILKSSISPFSIVNRINDLNRFDFSKSIEWEFEENMLVPKRLKLIELEKSFFENELEFERIRWAPKDTPYFHSFSLLTNRLKRLNDSEIEYKSFKLKQKLMI